MRLAWTLAVVTLTAVGGQTSITRDQHLAALRTQARERIELDRQRYSPREWDDIERRYRRLHLDEFPRMLRPDAAPLVRDLVETYPASSRAGCAALELAQRSRGSARETDLARVIADHDDAWCDDGVQVGALARAHLAIYYAGLNRWDDADRLVAEIPTRFAGAIDSSGAPLDDMILGLKLLRSSK
jgi:hypothetical protein